MSSGPQSGALQAKYLEEVSSRIKKQRGYLFPRFIGNFQNSFSQSGGSECLSKYTREKHIGEIRPISYSAPTQADLIEATLKERSSPNKAILSPPRHEGNRFLSPPSSDREQGLINSENPCSDNVETRPFPSPPTHIQEVELINPRWNECESQDEDGGSPSNMWEVVDWLRSSNLTPSSEGGLSEKERRDVHRNFIDREDLVGALQPEYVVGGVEPLKPFNISPARPIQHAPKEFKAQDVCRNYHDVQAQTGVLQASALERALEQRKSSCADPSTRGWRSMVASMLSPSLK